jgi:small subunit ribosomal protein S17
MSLVFFVESKFWGLHKTGYARTEFAEGLRNMSEAREIGLDVKAPERSCEDPNCPFHGSLRIHGRLLTGKVVSVSASKMAVVLRESYRYNKKYMRYLKRRSKLHAHLPPCVDLKVGENATVAECRPVAKSVSFVVVRGLPAVIGSSPKSQ